jgi:hypothetical protein
MLRVFLMTRDGFRSMHPEWSRVLRSAVSLGYVYGRVYGDVASMDRVVAITRRCCDKQTGGR